MPIYKKVKKKYGKIHFDSKTNDWVITQLAPHVMIKLKLIFESINKSRSLPIKIPNLLNNVQDIYWFMQRYPLNIEIKDFIYLKKQLLVAEEKEKRLEEILQNNYDSVTTQIHNHFKIRDYQEKAVALFHQTGNLLVGDDVGLGKTVVTIASASNPNFLPALIVVEPHLLYQWKEEVNKFTNLRVHLIDQKKDYDLPPADIYITKYNMLYDWANRLRKVNLKMVAYDEIQQLRRIESNKYAGAKILSKFVPKCLGLSATPIFNYGDEIFNVMDIIKPGCLGRREDFLREWTNNGEGKIIKDPSAMGAFLRDNYLMIRRNRSDVDLPDFEMRKIIQKVPHDYNTIRKEEEVLKTLAHKVLEGNYFEKGQAARELDIKMRYLTGMAKAKAVSDYAKIFLERGENIVLAGWHRGVYDVWKEELKKYSPLLYTGSESKKKKHENIKAFKEGSGQVLIMSLRSGAGINGLQENCNTIIFGELDWSPAVHKQLQGRLARDGQSKSIDIIFVTTDYGSDPLMIDMLGLKGSQAKGIIDPFNNDKQIPLDDSRLKKLAETIIQAS